MPDLSLEILLKTLADLHGTDAVTDALNKVKAGTGAAADSTGDLTGATGKLSDSQEEAAGSAEKLHINHRALHALMHMIGRETAPELGRALTGALYGPIGIAIAVGFAFEAIRKKLNEVNIEADKLNEQELKDHQAAVKMVETGWENAQAAIGKYYAAMATAGDEKDPIKKQLDGIKAVTDAQLAGTKQVIEALGRQEVAGLRARGGTPDQISAVEERTRREVEALDAQKQRAGGVGALQSEQAVRGRENQRLQDEANTAMAEAQKAKAALDAEKAKLTAAGAILDPTSEAGKSFAKRQEDAAAAMASARAGGQFISASGMGGGGPLVPVDKDKAVADAQERLRMVELERERAQKEQSQLQERLHVVEQSAAEAETRSREAQERSTTNQGRLRELPGDISQAGRLQGAGDRTRAEMDALNTRGGKTNETLAQYASERGVTDAQMLNILERIINHTMTVQQAFTKLGQRQAILEQQMQNAHAAVP